MRGTSWIWANYGVPSFLVRREVMTRKKPGVTPAKCLVSYLPLPVNYKAKGGAVEDGVRLVLQIGHGVTKSWAVEAFGIVDIKQ